MLEHTNNHTLVADGQIVAAKKNDERIISEWQAVQALKQRGATYRPSFYVSSAVLVQVVGVLIKAIN